MTAFINQLCPRCGSPRIETRPKKQKVETYSGIIEIEVSDIICTNRQCQKDFEKELEEEMIAKAAIRTKKQEQDLDRKEQMIRQIAETRKKNASLKK